MLSDGLKQELKEMVKGTLSFNEPLRRHVTLKVGGPADVFVEPIDRDDLRTVLGWARHRGIRTFILGNGSNVLVRDGGYRGMIVNLKKALTHYTIHDDGRVEAEAGVPLSQIIRETVEKGWAGFEILYGIPGTIGGAVFMNAGTRKGEIGDTLESVTVMDREGKEKVIPKEKLAIEYRHVKLPKGSVVLAASFQLKKDDLEAIKTRLGEVRDYRQNTQPIQLPNTGSVFKNPDKSHPAGQLIEEAGLKGVRVGQVRVSDMHANWIVNEGDGTAKDVEVLIRLIKEKVKGASGFKLETEIIMIGEEDNGDVER